MKGLLRRIGAARAAVWLLRAAVAGLLLCALVPAALRSGPASRWISSKIVAALASRTGREVRLGSAHAEVFPLSARIRGLDLSGPGGSFDPPFLQVRDASAIVSIRALLRGEIVVDAVEVDGVSLEWSAAEAPAGGAARDRDGGGRSVTLRRLNLRNGELRWEGRTSPFTLEADSIEATASSIPCSSKLCVGGTARAGRLSAVFDDHRLEGDAVSLQFEYADGRLDVPRFRITGAGLEVAGRARWEGGAASGGEVTARLAGEGEALRPLAGSFPVRADALEAGITLALQGGEARLAGRAQGRNVTCFEDVRARSATMTVSYADRIFTADVIAEGVLPEIDPRLRPSRSAPVEGTIRIEPDGAGTMDLSAGPFLYTDLLARLDPRLPRADLMVTAEGELRWARGQPGSLEGSLDVVAEPAASTGVAGGGPSPGAIAGEPPHSTGEGAVRPAVPIHATAHVGIGRGEVRLGEGHISAPGLETALAGRITTDGRRTELEIPVERMDLGPTLRALAGLPAARFALAQELSGTAAGRVSVSIRGGAATVRGSLTGSDLALGPGASQVRIPRAEIPFTVAGGAIDIQGMSLAGSGWTAEGSLGLSTTTAWPLRRAHARFRDAPASPLWAALALDEMEGGTISGAAVFDLDDEAGGGGAGSTDLRLSGGRLAGIDLLDTHLLATERGGTCHIDRLEAASAAGGVSAEGVWSPDTGEGEIRISAQDLQLGDLLAAWAPERKEDRGLVTIEGVARLAPGAVAFRGSGHASGLETAGFPLGAVLARRIEYSAGAGAAGLDMDFEAPTLGASGSVQLGPEEGAPLRVSLEARGLDLARLHPLLGEEALPGLGGRADLSLEGTIPTGDPWSAEIDGKLRRLSLEIGGLTFTMTGEPAVTVRRGEIDLGETRLAGEGTDLLMHGTYDLRSGRAGTGKMSGTFDARILALVVPGLDAQGPARVDLEISAAGDRVEYRGRLTASGIRLDHAALPSPVENLSLAASVDPAGKVDVTGIDFDFSGGKVTGGGTGRLDGLRLAEAEIRLRGAGLSTEPIPALAVLFDAEASFTLEGDRGVLAGRMDVVRAVYRKEFGLPAASLGRGRVVPDEQARPGGRSMSLDFDIVAPSGVLVRNESAQLEGSADLEVTGTLTRPELTGTITLFEGGTFRFRDVTYRSAGGGILFDDPDVVDPLLNFTAVADVQEYAIKLHVFGRYSDPKFDLTSEPPLPQRDIVSLLITGEIQASASGAETGAGVLAEENVALYLTAPLSDTLTSTVGRALGLTSVQLSPQFVNGSADPTARLTLTKRVSQHLLFTYSDNLGTSQDEIYQFEYDLSRAWQLIGLRDRDGSVSGNLRFRYYWGGPPRAGAGIPSRDAAAPGRPEVSRVLFEGSPIGDEATLRKRTGIRPGRPFSRADALEGREELRRWLGREGYPLATIRMEEIERQRDDGTRAVDLKYVVDPGRAVDLEIGGVKKEGAHERAVREEWMRGIDVEDLTASGERLLRERLGSRGYASAAVATRVREESSPVRIRYEVDQGPKVSVESIRFRGGGSVPAEEIERAMGTREDRWNTSGVLRTDVLSSDVEAIRAVYLSRGYLDVAVGKPSVTISDDRRRASVEIPITEGEPWKAGEVVIEGVTTYPAQGLAEATLITPGTLLRPSIIQSAEERVRDLLDANGYLGVRVVSRVEGRPSEARVVLEVEEGPRQVVDRVQIRGNERTADRVIRREFELRPGDPVSRNAMLEIQRKLYTLGLFRSVDVRAETTPEDPGRARVIIHVVEGAPILTGVGVGYDTEEALQGLVQVGHSNVFGSGRSVSLLLRGSGVNRRAQASLIDRRLFGVPFEGTLTASWEEEERTSFDVRRTGVGVQFRRKVTPSLTALGRYDLSDVDLLSVEIDPGTPLDEEDQEILDEAVRLGHVGGSLARDTRDDILAPKRGAFTTADLGVYSEVFGSSDSFAKIYLRASRFFATRGGIVFGLAARAGHEEPFAETQVIPLAARFFSGGDNTLRGFAVDEAGPLDFTSEEPIGGEFQLLLNAEMRFPIYRAIKGVVFYDAGNTFLTLGDFSASGTEILTSEVAGIGDCAYNLDPLVNPNVPSAGERTCPVAIQDGLRHTLGAGIRLDTPVGPIRFEVGRKMDRRFGTETFDLRHGFFVDADREESLYEIFLSIGSAF